MAETKEPKVQPKKEMSEADIQTEIRKQVLEILGRPDDYAETRVPKAGNAWRVNVYRSCGPLNGVRITDSFYVHVDEKGIITSASPTIKPRYHRRAAA